MAVYIDDSGAYERDALFNGVEDTAWTRDETNDLIWFSGTGTSSTGFTLPSATAWIVYEVYAVDSHTNDLTDGTNVYAWVEYTSTIGTIATTLETWKTAWESTATTRGYTTYKIKATHYLTGDEADVYYATEAATDFSKLVADGVDGGTFTGYGAWSISDTMLADGVSTFTSYDVYLNFDDASADTQDSAGNYLNRINTQTDSGVPASFVDSDNTTVSGFDYTVTAIGSLTWYAGNTSHTNCMETEQIERALFVTSTASAYEADILLPSGTWTATVLCSRDSSINGDTEVSFDGDSVNVQANNSNSGTHCGEVTGISSNGSTEIAMVVGQSPSSANNQYLNAIKFTKTS